MANPFDAVIFVLLTWGVIDLAGWTWLTNSNSGACAAFTAAMQIEVIFNQSQQVRGNPYSLHTSHNLRNLRILRKIQH